MKPTTKDELVQGIEEFSGSVSGEKRLKVHSPLSQDTTLCELSGGTYVG